jgi:Na+-driven multidrug efflux pump
MFTILYNFKSEIISRAAYLTKFLALCHLADAAQGFAGGIFRAIGAQRYVFFMVLFSFYLIGIPTGLYLMIETKLRVLGIKKSDTKLSF